ERLGVLPPIRAGEYRGRPLDQHRNGFMLAELAAAVVLERVDEGDSPPASINNQKSKIKNLILENTAVATEAYDMIGPAPGMPALERVARRLLTDRPIDVLHPHATGTRDHDPGEMDVYARCLKSKPTDCSPRASRASGASGASGGSGSPAVYASKGALGHGL